MEGVGPAARWVGSSSISRAAATGLDYCSNMWANRLLGHVVREAIRRVEGMYVGRYRCTFWGYKSLLWLGLVERMGTMLGVGRREADEAETWREARYK